MTTPTDDERWDTIEEARSEGLVARASELARQYVRAKPDDPDALFQMGLSLLDLELYQEARRTFEAALAKCSVDVRPWIFALLAMTCKASGSLVEAEQYCRKAVAAAPKEASHVTDLVSILMMQARIGEAESVLRKGMAAKAKPVSDVLLALGRLLCTSGTLEESFTCFQQILDKAPEHEDAIIAMQDLKEVAELRGVELPPTPESENEETEESEPSEPECITANIERRFFADIAAGRKKIEYRPATDFWEKKIIRAGLPPFNLRLINGMKPNAPELTAVVDRVLLDCGEGVYELHLGNVIDLKNWDLRHEKPK